jgi:hypothetical protein
VVAFVPSANEDWLEGIPSATNQNGSCVHVLCKHNKCVLLHCTRGVTCEHVKPPVGLQLTPDRLTLPQQLLPLQALFLWGAVKKSP